MSKPDDYLLLAAAVVLVWFGVTILLARRREAALRGALAEKENMLAGFFAASPVGMYMLDEQLRCMQINPALAAFVDIRQEEAPGMACTQVLPGLAVQVEAVQRKIAETDAILHIAEIAGTTPTYAGEARFWDFTAFPIRNAAGRLIAIGGMVLEVSERHRANRLLGRWHQIFEHADWGVVVVGSDDENTMELMNPAFARMHGCTQEELIGQPIKAIFAAEARGELAANIASSHFHGHHRFESLHVHRDGRIFPVLIDVTTVRGAGDQLLYRIASVQDISDIRRAQEEVRLSKEFFKNLFEYASLGNAVVDRAGRFIRVNRAMCEFVGYSEAELLTLGSADITHPDDVARQTALRLSLLEQNRAQFRLEKRYLHKDGRIL